MTSAYQIINFIYNFDASALPAQKPETEKYRPSANLQRVIHKQDQGRCQFRNEATGRQCTSTHFLQIDHIQPYAWGGKTELKNLRLLCCAHHRLISQQQFGRWNMFKASQP